MKKISALLLTLAMIPAVSALDLRGSNGVEIVAVDGKKISSSFFSSKDMNLTEGQHQVVVRYSKQFNKDGVIESKPTIFTLSLKQDTEISVKTLNSYANAEREIKKGLTWRIKSDDKSYNITNADTLKGEGFMPYGKIEELIEDYNQKNNISIVTPTVAQVAKPNPTTIITATAVTTAAVTSAVDAQNMSTQPLTSLSVQYQNATKEEKKAFRLWLLEQDMK